MLSGLANVKETLRNLEGNMIMPKMLTQIAHSTLETSATSDRINNLQKMTYTSGFLSKQASIIDKLPRGATQMLRTMRKDLSPASRTPKFDHVKSKLKLRSNSTKPSKINEKMEDENAKRA